MVPIYFFSLRKRGQFFEKKTEKQNIEEGLLYYTTITIRTKQTALKGQR